MTQVPKNLNALKLLICKFTSCLTPIACEELKGKKKIICTIYSTFNFSQTVGEMVFVSFEVEKTRIILVQSVVRWCWVFMRSWGAAVSFPV